MITAKAAFLCLLSWQPAWGALPVFDQRAEIDWTTIQHRPDEPAARPPALRVRVAAVDLKTAEAAGGPAEAVRLAAQKIAQTRGKVIWDMDVFTEPRGQAPVEGYRAMQLEFFRQVERFDAENRGTFYIGIPGDNTEAQAERMFLDAAKASGSGLTKVPASVRFASVAIAASRDMLAMVRIPGPGKLLPMALKVFEKDWPDDSRLVTVPLEPQPLRGMAVDHTRDHFSRYIDGAGHPAGPATSVVDIASPIDADVTIFAFHLPSRDVLHIPGYGAGPGYFAMILSLLTAQGL